MAKYTTELYKLLSSTKAIDDYGTPVNFKSRCLSSYPIFDEEYRDTLNDKIIHHFYYREIGSETIQQFCDRFEWEMQLIMPKYNRMYKILAETDGAKLYEDNYTEKTEYRDLHDYEDTHNRHYSEDGDRTTTSTKKGKETMSPSGEETHKTIRNETPQNSQNNVFDVKYATETNQDTMSFSQRKDELSFTDREDKDKTEYNQTYDNNLTDNIQAREYDNTVKRTGRKGFDFPEFLRKYEKNIWEIEKMIFKDLEPLFMGLY